MVTNDLSSFGNRELNRAKDILESLIKDGVPEDFEMDEVNLQMNTRSGYVFLTNSRHQSLLLNDGRLEIYHYCSECGIEGFEEEIGYNKETGLCEECDR